jgi:uncharacterized repeat protein (TIGR01451 family)
MPQSPISRLKGLLRGGLFLALAMAGASGQAQALTNGNFETPYVAPNIDGWLKTRFLNFGLVGATPYNGTSIVRSAGGTDKTDVLSTLAGSESQVDADLGAAQSLRWPKFGTSCVLVNPQSSSLYGLARNGNSIKQTFTLDASMLDALDGRLHIRFAFAPVLENPGHAVSQQPFFYIGVKDISKAGVVLYDNLNFSNQPGSPWKTTGGIVYTDWQIKDIALDPAVYLNDTIEIEFLGAGCSLGGHWGKLYVDGIASQIPGLWVSVTSTPTNVPVGGHIFYTYTVRNTGATTQTNVEINAIVPINTTFFALTDAGGRLSQAGGVIATTLPFPSGHTMAPGDTYTFVVDVTVNAGTPAGTEITSGNYYAKADNYGSLYGSPVKNYVNGTGTDLAVTLTPSLVGCNTVYTATITNTGATASQAQASLPLPAGTSLVAASTTLGLVTGANPVVANLGDMASGATATFTVTVRPTTTAAVSGTVTVSGNFVDTVPANDSSTSAIANPLGGPAVNITTQPVGATIIQGSTHAMNVVAQDGCGGFTYQWYLNGVLIPAATASTYTTPVLAVGTYNYTVRVTEGSGFYVLSDVATVVVRNPLVTVGPLTNGSLDVTTPSPASVPTGSTTSFTFNAAPGYHVASISGCSGPLYTNTSNAVSSYTYTTGAITADCTVSATFAINVYQVTAPPSPNGTLDPSTPSPVAVPHGGTTNFMFNANPGYHIATITGCYGSPYLNTSNTVSTYTYTTGPITTDCSVVATYAVNLLLSFTPASGRPGTVVILSGTNISSVTAVTFNGVPATFTQLSPTQVSAVVPAGATTGPIFVTNSAGLIQSTSTFTVPVAAPRILSFSPNAGATGTVVFINGVNLGGTITVTFNGAAAAFTQVSATQLKATVPAAATTGPIAVTTPGGTTSTGSVKFKKL